jgi:hypothetical protein
MKSRVAAFGFWRSAFWPVWSGLALVVGCGSETSGANTLRDASIVTPDAGIAEAAVIDAAPTDMRAAVARDRFGTGVVSFSPGTCAGFGSAGLPGVVLNPPEGGGAGQGGTNVVSLGTGGSIVLSFEGNPIVDGLGVDFLVFENVFLRGGDPKDAFVEPGEVSVSDDGSTWKTFPCAATALDYDNCAGVRPVYSASTNTRSAIDPMQAGGDGFDLAVLSMTRARFVRIVDKGQQECIPGAKTNGFDLDAVASVHSERP